VKDVAGNVAVSIANANVTKSLHHDEVRYGTVQYDDPRTNNEYAT